MTGYDLCKLMAGSYGTLAALEEVTVKVLPRPETVATVLFSGVAPGPAVRLMGMALGSPHEVSGAAYLPAGTAGLREGRVALRVEGPAPSVMARRDSLLQEHRGVRRTAELLGDAKSAALWRAIGEVAPLFGARASARCGASRSRRLAAPNWPRLWRARSRREFLLDWGGGLVWARGAGDRRRCRRRGDPARDPRNDGSGTGHATLVKGSAALRRAVAVFEPLPAPLAALSRRVKEAFDPEHILNPGRMVPIEAGRR